MTQHKQTKAKTSGLSLLMSLGLFVAVLLGLFVVFYLIRAPRETLGLAYQIDSSELPAKPRARSSTDTTNELSSQAAPISAAPSTIQAGIEQAQEYLDQGSVAESDALLRTLQEKDPQNEELMLQRAMLASREKGDAAEARVLLEDLLSKDPAQVAAADELFYAYESLEDLQGGIRSVQALAAKADASSKPALDYLLGRLLMESGKPQEGSKLLEHAVEEGARDPSVREQLAASYARSGHADKEKEVLENLAEDEVPSYPSLTAKAKLAERLAAEGKTDEAKEQLKSVLALAPGHPYATQILARFDAQGAPAAP